MRHGSRDIRLTEYVKTCLPERPVWLREFLIFGLKQAWACLFAAVLLAAMLITQIWYPFGGLERYDFLFLVAVLTQGVLIAGGLEHPHELRVIILFHLVATGLELFKTAPAIASWYYPEDAFFALGTVPLFAGFMYSAVGSYLARAWRLFDFRFRPALRPVPMLILAVIIYLNFFTHHYIWDLRYLLFAATTLLFAPVRVEFRIDRTYRSMPLLLGFLLVALFIYLAENIATYTNIWLYPTQESGWSTVPVAKLGSWFLLMIVSFVLVALANRARRPSEEVTAAS